MAIIDKNKNNWDVDSSNEDQFIGFTLPLLLDNGTQASTKTTIEAVKQNLMNLCSTEAGERVMQPNLGVRLKRFLFEPFSQDLVEEVKVTISESISYWLPFIKINNIHVQMSENETGDFRNLMEVIIHFSLNQSPNTQDSVQVTVGE